MASRMNRRLILRDFSLTRIPTSGSAPSQMPPTPCSGTSRRIVRRTLSVRHRRTPGRRGRRQVADAGSFSTLLTCQYRWCRRMKAKLPEAIAEAVRASPAPYSQAVKIASDPGVRDATSRQVGKDLWRPEQPVVGLWIGLVGVGHVRACTKMTGCGRYTLEYSYFPAGRNAVSGAICQACGHFFPL